MQNFYPPACTAVMKSRDITKFKTILKSRKGLVQNLQVFRWIHQYSFLLLFLMGSVSAYNVLGQTQTFTTDGTFTVPAGITSIDVVAKGTQGGNNGGGGGIVSATLSVTPGEVLLIKIAAKGGNGYSSANFGGGATDIRTSEDISSRIVVAGGGGGKTVQGIGGAGGGLIGGNGTTPAGTNAAGQGGTQSAGGAGGIGTSNGDGGNGGLGTGGNANASAGGGGGAGYYGGGGGAYGTATSGGGGGGGSSYTDPTRCTNVVHTQGGNNGAGSLIISWVVSCTPSVSIAANPGNNITAGTSVTFTATPTNGGTTPTYQWKKNGNNVGMNQATYTDATLADGDVITCGMTSSDACASPTTATSDEIVIKVFPAGTVCVSTVCGSYAGNYSPVGDPGVVITAGMKNFLKDADGNLIFFFTPFNAWFIANTNGGGINPFFRNASTDQNNVPLTGWSPFTFGDTPCNEALSITQGPCIATGCTNPIAYTVTGGGAYCTGGAGVAIGLSDSETGVTYQLKNGMSDVGTPVSGTTGMAISFGNQTAAGTYTVVATRTTGGCTATMTGSATVTVNALPTASISGTTAVCKDAPSPNVTFTGAGGTAPYTFTYKINGGSDLTVTTSSGNSVTVPQSTTTAGPFEYTLVSVKESSATMCSQAQSGSATVTVNPLPTATISGTIAVCQNAPSPNMTFTGAMGTAPYTFTYKINGGDDLMVSTTSGSSVNVSVPTGTVGNFVYSLVSVKDGSSTQCSQTQSGSATVTVNPLPTASISGTTVVCQNDASPNVAFTGAVGTAPYTFTYKINGGDDLTVSTTSGSSVNVSVPTGIAGSFVYSLVSVKDASVTQCSQAQSGSATVTVKPTPTSALSASKQDVCPNTEISLNANCSEIGSTVNWNPGGATVTPNAPDVAYTYKASCTLNGCTGNESSVEVRTHRILVDLKEVGMGTQPKALAGVVKDNLAPTNTFLTSTYPAPRLWTILASGCSASESAVFKLTGPVSFSNIDNNPPYALFANVGSDYFSIDHPNYGQGAQGFPVGTYTLVVDLRSADGVGGPFPKNRVAVGGLLATRSLQFMIVAPTNREGVEALSTLSSVVETREWLSIFQNPVSEEVVLQLSGEVGEEIALNLVNLQGQSIQQRSVKLSSPQQYEVLNVRQQNAGMYILKAIKGGQVKTLKVVKAE